MDERYCTHVHLVVRPVRHAVKTPARAVPTPDAAPAIAELSPRQREILDFLVAEVTRSGVVPSYREIGASLGIDSTNAVSDHIKALIKKGYVERVGEPGRPRSLRLTEPAAGFLSDDAITTVHMLGRIAAGVPLLAEENYRGFPRLS